jgi:hypothetical protein
MLFTVIWIISCLLGFAITDGVWFVTYLGFLYVCYAVLMSITCGRRVRKRRVHGKTGIVTGANSGILSNFTPILE